MKKFIFIICSSLILTTLTLAQHTIKVRELKENIGNGTHPCLSVTIYETTTEAIEKSWEKLMKSYDGKISSKKEIFADNVLIKDISNNTIDVYAKCIPKNENEIEFLVAVDLGGAFMNSSDHSSQFKTMEKIVKNFAKQTTLEGIDNKINNQQKVFDKRVKEMKNLKKDKEKLEKDIENYKEKIKKAEEDIKKNLDDQASKQKEIDTEKAKLDEIIKLKNKVD